MYDKAIIAEFANQKTQEDHISCWARWHAMSYKKALLDTLDASPNPYTTYVDVGYFACSFGVASSTVAFGKYIHQIHNNYLYHAVPVKFDVFIGINGSLGGAAQVSKTAREMDQKIIEEEHVQTLCSRMDFFSNCLASVVCFCCISRF